MRNPKLNGKSIAIIIILGLLLVITSTLLASDNAVTECLRVEAGNLSPRLRVTLREFKDLYASGYDLLDDRYIRLKDGMDYRVRQLDKYFLKDNRKEILNLISGISLSEERYRHIEKSYRNRFFINHSHAVVDSNGVICAIVFAQKKGVYVEIDLLATRKGYDRKGLAKLLLGCVASRLPEEMDIIIFVPEEHIHAVYLCQDLGCKGMGEAYDDVGCLGNLFTINAEDLVCNSHRMLTRYVVPDEIHMREITDLAKSGDSPIVARIVDINGNVVSTATPKKYETPTQYGAYGLHAEINAIRQAEAKGFTDWAHSTLYVTLEPCYKCSRALTEFYGFRRVVYGLRDELADVDRNMDGYRDNGVLFEQHGDSDLRRELSDLFTLATEEVNPVYAAMREKEKQLSKQYRSVYRRIFGEDIQVAVFDADLWAEHGKGQCSDLGEDEINERFMFRQLEWISQNLNPDKKRALLISGSKSNYTCARQRILDDELCNAESVRSQPDLEKLVFMGRCVTAAETLLSSPGKQRQDVVRRMSNALDKYDGAEEPTGVGVFFKGVIEAEDGSIIAPFNDDGIFKVVRFYPGNADPFSDSEMTGELDVRILNNRYKYQILRESVPGIESIKRDFADLSRSAGGSSVQTLRDKYYMRRVLDIADSRLRSGKFPIACIVVNNTTGEEIIIEERVKIHGVSDKYRVPQHVEMVGLQQAVKKDWKLRQCSLYVSVENCYHCAKAIRNNFRTLGKVIVGCQESEQKGRGFAVLKDSGVPLEIIYDDGLRQRAEDIIETYKAGNETRCDVELGQADFEYAANNARAVLRRLLDDPTLYDRNIRVREQGIPLSIDHDDVFDWAAYCFLKEKKVFSNSPYPQIYALNVDRYYDNGNIKGTIEKVIREIHWGRIRGNPRDEGIKFNFVLIGNMKRCMRIAKAITDRKVLGPAQVYILDDIDTEPVEFGSIDYGHTKVKVRSSPAACLDTIGWINNANPKFDLLGRTRGFTAAQVASYEPYSRRTVDRAFEILKDLGIFVPVEVEGKVNRGHYRFSDMMKGCDQGYSGRLIDVVSNVRFQIGTGGDERPLMCSNIPKEERPLVEEILRLHVAHYLHARMEGLQSTDKQYVIKAWDGYSGPSQESLLTRIRQETDVTGCQVSFEAIDGLLSFACAPENINDYTVVILPSNLLNPEQLERLALARTNVIYINMAKEKLAAYDVVPIESIVAVGRAYLAKDEETFYKLYEMLTRTTAYVRLAFSELKEDPMLFIDTLHFVLKPITARNASDLSRINRRMRDLIAAA